MRTLRREWRNKRSGWTRRIRWYQGAAGDNVSIRLELMDEHYEENRFFTDPGIAREKWDLFKALADERPPLQPGDKSVVKEVLNNGSSHGGIAD